VPIRRLAITLLPLALLAAPFAVEAQQAEKAFRIGWLSEADGPTATTQSFLQRLRDLGYVEGQHFIMEYRWAAGKRERLPELAADLVQAKVDVIVAAGTAPTLPAVRATGAIPIVFVAFYPVERGIVASLARPGANVTGVALHVGLAKHLQLLKESVPRISRVAYFRTVGITLTTALATLETEAKRLGVKLDLVPVRQ
jgi:putative tryptophan/tyrosine transport system substrate-binding protein